MLRTSDVNRGGVPPARVSTQDDHGTFVPMPTQPTQAARWIGTHGVVPVLRGMRNGGADGT